jgi:hypothetical protein
MKESRRYDPVKSSTKKVDSDEDEHEDGWDVTLVKFRAKIRNIVRNGQPPGGLSPETALAAKILEIVKDDLKRSVSRIFYCVLVHRFTNSAILATATPGHQGWRGKTPAECGGLPHQPTEGDPPGKANPHSGPGQIVRERYEVGRLRKT